MIQSYSASVVFQGSLPEADLAAERPLFYLFQRIRSALAVSPSDLPCLNLLADLLAVLASQVLRSFVNSAGPQQKYFLRINVENRWAESGPRHVRPIWSVSKRANFSPKIGTCSLQPGCELLAKASHPAFAEQRSGSGAVLETKRPAQFRRMTPISLCG